MASASNLLTSIKEAFHDSAGLTGFHFHLQISGEEATVERGATEAVGAEVETEVATVQTEVGVAMVQWGWYRMLVH